MIAVRRGLFRSWLKPRLPDANKGDFGHVLVLAGSRGMMGAARLCAAATLRSGAGLVTLGVPESQADIAARRPPWEWMTLPLRDRRGALRRSALFQVSDFLQARRVTSMAAGPGLSVTPDTEKFISGLLSKAEMPVVLDADGLNALAKQIWPKRRSCLVITPHPGELARLLKISVSAVQADRPGAAARISRQRGVICVLKGRRTLVTDGRRSFVNGTGNPGLATGGTGDVLCGLIAGLIGQTAGATLSEKALRAAVLGVYLHGLAGDLGVRQKTRIGFLAGDLLDFLPAAFRRTFGLWI